MNIRSALPIQAHKSVEQIASAGDQRESKTIDNSVVHPPNDSNQPKSLRARQISIAHRSRLSEGGVLLSRFGNGPDSRQPRPSATPTAFALCVQRENNKRYQFNLIRSDHASCCLSEHQHRNIKERLFAHPTWIWRVTSYVRYSTREAYCGPRRVNMTATGQHGIHLSPAGCERLVADFLPVHAHLV